ncbi:hypothetical protein [Streptomyces phaeochromogenes]|uniref:hypothetical protein n=1 Tax=Streptomyces phaeochromogenes TaxID=1923 RepID=UPI0033E63FE8
MESGSGVRRMLGTLRVTRPAIVATSCAICGVEASLERHFPTPLHLLVSVPTGPGGAAGEFGNLLVLCANCHRFEHSRVSAEEVAKSDLSSNDQALQVLSGKSGAELGRQVISPVCVAGVEALRRWFMGDQGAVVEFGAVWLGLGAQHKEAVETALMSDWLVDVDLTDTGTVIASLNREVAHARAILKPLWDRFVGGQTLRMLGEVGTRNGSETLSGLLADVGAQPPDVQVLQRMYPSGQDPCVAAVLDTLGLGDRSVAIAYAQGADTWTQAAAIAGADRPGSLGERVRRMLKYRGEQHVRHAEHATWKSDGDRCAHGGPLPQMAGEISGVGPAGLTCDTWVGKVGRDA